MRLNGSLSDTSVTGTRRTGSVGGKKQKKA